MKKGLGIAYALLGVLFLSALLLSLGEREIAANPAATSKAPSGTAAFAELLRRSGYTVVIDRRETPRLPPRDLAVAFPIRAESTPEDDAQADAPFSDRFRDSLREYVREGGTLMVLPLDRNFQKASRDALRGETLVREGRAQMRISVPGKPRHDFASAFSEGAAKTSSIWSGHLTTTPFGNGVVVSLGDGLPATNRFLDRAENAEWLLNALSAVADSKGRVVLVEAASGIVRSPGLLESIGSWASVAWWQVLFVGGVIAFSLGRRFGLPEPTPYRQRGSRELVDAIGSTLGRGRKASAALLAAVEESESRLRRWKKIPRDASEAELGRLLPEELVVALQRARAAALDDKVTTAQALKLAQGLEEQVNALLAV